MVLVSFKPIAKHRCNATYEQSQASYVLDTLHVIEKSGNQGMIMSKYIYIAELENGEFSDTYVSPLLLTINLPDIDNVAMSHYDIIDC